MIKNISYSTESQDSRKSLTESKDLNLNSVVPVKTPKRENDFREAFERFLAEYRMDRIADTHDFLENNAEYKKIHSDKTERENVLQAAFQETNMNIALLDYITVVEDLIDNVKTMFYEHGFQDCATVFKTMQEGLNGISLRTLLDLDIE